MWGWVRDHKALVATLSVVSLVTALGSLILLPWVVANWPRDRFVAGGPKSTQIVERHPLLKAFLFVFKNLLGLLLIAGGVLMLVLPGQGLLTLLLGVLLVDFPGKLELERRLVARPRVLRALNWLRRKTGRPPFRSPRDGGGDGENMQDGESEGTSAPNSRNNRQGFRRDQRE